MVAMAMALLTYAQEMEVTGVSGASGGKLAVGAKFGPVFKNLYGSDVTNNKMGAGFQFGVHGNYKFTDMISGQVEMNLEGKGARFKAGGVTSKLRLTYFTIPFMARGDFGLNDKMTVFANTGFFVGFLLGVRVDGDKELTYTDYIYDPMNPFAPPQAVTKTEKYKDDYKTLDFGWLIGGGFAYEVIPNLKAFADMRINLGLVNIPDASNNNKAKTFSFVIGFGAEYTLPY